MTASLHRLGAGAEAGLYYTNDSEREARPDRRDEYYLARQEPRLDTPEHEKWQQDMEAVHNVAEVIVGKQRHGPVGKVELQFQPELTRFSNLEREGKSNGLEPF